MTGDEGIDWEFLAAECADLPELPEPHDAFDLQTHLSAAGLVSAVLDDDGARFLDTARTAVRPNPDAWVVLLMATARVAAAGVRIAADATGRTPESLIEAIRNTLLNGKEGD